MLFLCEKIGTNIASLLAKSCKFYSLRFKTHLLSITRNKCTHKETFMFFYLINDFLLTNRLCTKERIMFKLIGCELGINTFNHICFKRS